MKAIDKFKALQKDFDAAIDRVITEHESKVSECIRDLLADWQRRFPKHTFRFWESMGMMSFEINPPIEGQHEVEYLGGVHPRYQTIADEARAFQDIYNIERRIGLVPDDAEITV